MNYKEVKMLEAVNLVMTGQEVYMLQRITSNTTIEALNGAKGFVLKTAEAPVKKAAQKEKNETPQKEKPQADEANKAIDHGKIVALYTATPPRPVTWIADEMGCSAQTVINHLKKEGVYKAKGERSDEA